MIITKKISWEMGHALSFPYVGKCNRLHGHSFTAEFSYEGELNESGMVLDFGEFKKMKTWIDEHLDHRFYVKSNHPILEPYYEGLDEWSSEIDTLGLVPVEWNPTSENIAKYIHEVCCSLMGLDTRKLQVTVWETCTSSATYSDKEGKFFEYEEISDKKDTQLEEMFNDLDRLQKAFLRPIMTSEEAESIFK